MIHGLAEDLDIISNRQGIHMKYLHQPWRLLTPVAVLSENYDVVIDCLTGNFDMKLKNKQTINP